jgi:hypothetical protein
MPIPIPRTGGAASQISGLQSSLNILSVSIPRKSISFYNKPWDPAQGTTPHGASNSWQYYTKPNSAPLLISHVDDHPGNRYQDIAKGDVVYVKFADGSSKPYQVHEVRDYDYWSTKAGPQVKSTHNFGSEHHMQSRDSAWVDSTADKDSIVFQTCITDGGARITGQKFVIAKPAPPTYSSTPPPPKVIAQSKGRK